MSSCAELAHWVKVAFIIPAQPDLWQIFKSVCCAAQPERLSWLEHRPLQ